MSFINHSTKTLYCKILYYGISGSGKTKNIDWLYNKYKVNSSTKLFKFTSACFEQKTLKKDFANKQTKQKNTGATLVDRFKDKTKGKDFELLAVDIDSFATFNARFYYYTVPSGDENKAYRKFLLKGVDGIVFVVEPQKNKLDDNKKALSELKKHLVEQGHDFINLPFVFQYNNHKSPDSLSIKEIKKEFNTNKVFYTTSKIKSEPTIMFKTFCQINKSIWSQLFASNSSI